jgi:hypothetical protein
VRPHGTPRNLPGQPAGTARTVTLPPVYTRTPENRQPIAGRRITGCGYWTLNLGGMP